MMTVCVFDAHTERSPNTTDFVVEGLRVWFAHQHREADDLIEDLIDQHPSPRSLVVVSSDRRIQIAASCRQAQAIDSRDWFDQLTLRYTESSRDLHASDDIDPEAIKIAPSMEHSVSAWIQYLEMEKLTVAKPSEDSAVPKAKKTPKRSPAKQAAESTKKKTKRTARKPPQGKTPTTEESGIDPKILKRANRKLPDDGPLFPEDYFDGFS
jgi:predicted RNA-binding protein with PIN domain